ncbi:MAG: type 1 periplasmic binding fold superfamily protein [Patiriisocius sp.]|uniref:type 1 periplasmic binding fold superfamily protein n=1 Tax=Patiriisocius sp. TaxID=2822396 RepID=UPI003EF6CB7B
MKNLKIFSAAIIAGLFSLACSNDDDTTPVPVNEEEVITTFTATLRPQGGGTAVILQSRDIDGDGGDAPVVTVSGNLSANTTYNGEIILLNETVSPPDNITTEVDEEGEEHQFFYTVGGTLDVTTTYVDFDLDGNPVGILFTLTANAASSGNLTFTLRHEPTKPNTGLGDAGGETDIAVTFTDVTVQ